MVSFSTYTFIGTHNSRVVGNAAYAGGFAALMANVVLVAYIYVAFQDDKKERAEEEAERKKKGQ